MPKLIHRKPLSPSSTTSPHKKTNSSQHERHLHEKLSIRNFSSSSKLKGSQDSQDGECDASSTSSSHYDARDIGNFDQDHHKGQKISTISQGTQVSRHSFRNLAKRFPKSFPQWQIKNKLELYVRKESKKNKLETDEDKLDNHHDDQDCIKNNTWYKGLWRELKKKAKRIVNSDVDADSSSDESVSIHTRHHHVTRRPSDSRNKLDKHFLPNENLSFPISKDVEVKIESWDRVTFHKIAPSVILESDIVYNNPPTPAFSSYYSIPNQNYKTDDMQDIDFAHLRVTDLNNMAHHKQFPSLAENQAHLKRGVTIQGQEIPMDASDRFSRGDDVDVRLQRSGASERSEDRPTHHTYICSDNHHTTYYPAEYSRIRISEGQNIREVVIIDAKAAAAKHEKMRNRINILPDEVKREFIKSKSIHPEIGNICFEDSADTNPAGQTRELMLHKEEYWTKSQTAQIKVNRLLAIFIHTKMETNENTNYIKDLQEEIRKSWAYKKELGNLEQYIAKVKRNIQPVEVKKKFLKISNSINPEGREASTRLMPELKLSIFSDDWDSLANFKLLVDIITSDKTGEESIVLKNALAGQRSKHKSTVIKLYRNIIRNETCRMMTSIDMVVSEAEHLFGHKRTQIFFDLLGDELFHFGSAGAAPGFIPRITESTVRQYVISFFEHSCEMMNRLVTLLLEFPDSRRLQQMPEQHFISLMRSVVDSSLKTKTKGGKKLSSKGITLIMVDSEEFVRALGDEIPEDVSDRLRHGQQMVAHRFVNTRLERTQVSEKRENRLIHSIYFPSDCRLFIYIPTENGSYWHQADMQRESRIRRHDR